MESKNEKGPSNRSPQAATVEELRSKRLAYFDCPTTHPSYREDAINYTEHTHSGLTNGSISYSISKTAVKEDVVPENKTPASLFKSQYLSPSSLSSGKLESQSCDSFQDAEHFSLEPRQSHGVPRVTSEPRHVDRGDRDSTGNIASEDFEPMAVFHSQASFSELGLSTHRPSDAGDWGTAAAPLTGLEFEPSSQGGGELARNIFGEKITEEMRSALGEEGLENLMLKVNKNLSQMHDDKPSQEVDFNANNRTGSSHFSQGRRDQFNRSTEIYSPGRQQKELQSFAGHQRGDSAVSQSGHNTGTSNFQHTKEGEKRVFTLSRNYDQVTVPRNTRNSFSADEIYQQAFGPSQELSMPLDKSYPVERYRNQWQQPPWSQHSEQSQMVDYHYSPLRRRLSHDSATMMPPHSSPRSQPQTTAAMAYPPTHMPPPGFSSARAAPPMSPHSPGPLTAPHGFQDINHPGYFYYGQLRGMYNPADSQYHVQSEQSQSRQAPYHSHRPQSSSAVPQSPSGFYYPPPAYTSQYSVPRFPHGVPLHLPPPPIPPQLKQGTAHQAYPNFPVDSARSSLSLQGTEESMAMKVPHPPHVPPALKTSNRDGSAHVHTGQDYRRLSASTEPIKSSYNDHSSSKAEDVLGHDSLQRYFSSMELHGKDMSSSSAEGSPKKHRNVSDGEEEEEYSDNDDDDDTASSSVSAFTSVTADTTAGGVTGRLAKLGVDLDHLRHLRVVDTSDPADFEKLSKGVRHCPECGAANKAYMDWCLSCGEIIIGVEPIIPGAKSRHADSAPGADKRSGRGSTSRGRNNNTNNNNSSNNIGSGGTTEQLSRSRDSSSQSRGQRSKRTSNSRGGAKTESDVYTPQESPESGKGLSLSSSPVRYRREQEEACDDPKDSGRASSNDGHEKFRSLGCKDDDSADDLEAMEEVEMVDYTPPTSESELFAEIKDPVLREFIISYRNRQILKEGSESITGQSQLSGNTSEVYEDTGHKVSRNTSEFYTRASVNTSKGHEDSIRASMDVISSVAGTRTSQFSIDLPSGKQKAVSPRNTQPSGQRNGGGSVAKGSSEPHSKGCDRTGAAAKSKAKECASSTTGKKKRKKKKVEPMDVEIFGYEEIRQSRDSSRASNTHAIPLLNLAGSSDEEDGEEESSEDDDDDGSSQGDDGSSSSNGGGEKKRDKHQFVTSKENGENPHSYSSYFNVEAPGHEGRQSQDSMTAAETSESVKLAGAARTKKDAVSRVRPQSASASVRNNSSSQTISQRKQQSDQQDVEKSSGTPSHARHGAPSGYQRHWARSSTAWSSYHPRELSTRSSLSVTTSERNSGTLRGGGSQSGSRDGPSQGDQSGTGGGGTSGIPVRQRPASAEYSRRTPPEPRRRPSSAQVRQSHGDAGGLAGQKPKGNNGTSAVTRNSRLYPPRASVNVSTNHRGRGPPGPSMLSGNGSGRSNDRESQSEASETSPRALCPELHRLPHEEHDDNLHATAKNSYDKIQQMTPRLECGELSIWQCLPDELWLFVFGFVSHADLGRLMRSCRYFHRLANDETLWKYITVRPKLAMTDAHLAAIAQHRPLSLAMVMSNGRELSQDALHSFFKDTQGRLKELNVCGCNQGTLTGSVVLDTAAQYCHGLTHIDVSYCILTDASLQAISLCADRLESLCVNGFQSLSDSCLLSVLRKHGPGLRTLEMYACFSLSASSLRSLGEHCTNLRRLCLGSCNKLTDSAMVTLSAHIPRVEELDLRGCKNLKNDSIRKIVRNCPRLSRLVLANCPHISDLALTEIATHLKTTLRNLELCGCNNVTDQGVTTLAKNCDRLTNVDISSTRCSSVSVYQLASNNCSRWLETVKLSFVTPLTEASVVSLMRQCPRLKVVHVFGCSSLRNLSKLRQVNRKVSVEGDENVNISRFSLSCEDF